MDDSWGHAGPSLGVEAGVDLAHARSLILKGLDGYKVDIYLFGSFARGQGMLGSDIDVGVLPLESIPRDVFSELRQRLEDSNLLFPVELVDLSATNIAFQELVRREGVRWNEPANASK